MNLQKNAKTKMDSKHIQTTYLIFIHSSLISNKYQTRENFGAFIIGVKSIFVYLKDFIGNESFSYSMIIVRMKIKAIHRVILL